jgi:hypothetical protein
MEVLRYYIHFDDYKNAILVSKTWRDYLVDSKGAMMLARIMSKDGYLCKNDLEFIKSIKGRRLVNMLIESFEFSRRGKHFELFLKKYKYPMTYYTSIIINKRPNLRYINLMGH